MTKNDFLNQLKEALYGLPQEEIQGFVDYYGEMIDDRTESGMSEEAATAELGTPQSIAHQIMLKMPMQAVIKSKCKKKRAWKPWEIILLILGSPIWLSLLVSLLAVIISVYAVLWVSIGCLWIADAAIFIASFASAYLFASTLTSVAVSALFYLGAALTFIGISALLFFACLKLTVLFGKLSVKITRIIKHLIIGNTKERK